MDQVNNTQTQQPPSLMESMRNPQFWVDALSIAITVFSTVRAGITIMEQVKMLNVAQMTQLADPNVIEGVGRIIEPPMPPV